MFEQTDTMPWNVVIGWSSISLKALHVVALESHIAPAHTTTTALHADESQCENVPPVEVTKDCRINGVYWHW